MCTPLYRLLPALTAWWVSVGVAWANYDEFMTCGSGSERYGRHYHHFPELPCDLSKDSWCESPGNQYPWSAVRRFVYENQGLMKRMYGNQRHYSVLRAELLNDLYDEMFDEMIKRPHHRQQPSPSTSSSSRSARYRKPSHPAANSPVDKGNQKRPHGSSRAMKVTIQPQYSSVRRQHAAPRPKTQTKPQRKATGTSRLTKTAQDRTSTTSSTSSTSSTASTASTSSTSTTKRASTTTTSTTTTSTITTSDVQPTTTTTITGDDVLTTTTFWGDAEEEDLGTASSPFEEETQATLLPPDDEWTWATTLTDPASTDPSSAFPTAYDGEEEEEEGESSYSLFTIPETSSPAPPTTQHDLSVDENGNKENKDAVDDDRFFREDFISTPLDEDDLTTLTLGDRLEGGTEYTKDEIDLGIEQVLSEDEELTGERKEEKVEVEVEDQDSHNLKAENREQVVMDELRVDGNVREEAKMEEIATTEGVQIKRPARGMNACPVEEEFVAPYWANNTRGETLALLNQYPFEQYIQWERCKHEHRQMYCRRGCRCEQQYRLHRLLAFDPTNECRGIFSDWFRFPSFCVCKCYDLPLHAFTTSQRMARLNQDGNNGEDDEQYNDYYDEDEEEDFELDEEEEEEEIKPEPYQKQDRTNMEKEKQEEAEEEEERNNPYYYPHRARPSSPLANIPPQRRPRPPPRPYSHISPPSHTLEAPSHLFTPSSPPQLPPTQPTEATTLGTVDAATPHYYFNLTNYARVFLAKGQPLALSRVPRSPEA